MASGSFESPPLDQEKSQFRLLQILPQPCSTWHYSLSTFNIAECPPYVTLSYVWGDDEPSHSIILNGQPFLIRNNLSDALPRLARLGRSKSSTFRREEKHFWIDAICIDQEDIRERGHQVERMAEIYTKSALTFAWLGQPIEDITSDTVPPLAAASMGGHLFYLFKFAVYPYFQRMWIVQEILLSRCVWVACGDNIYDLDKIVLGADFDLPPKRMYTTIPGRTEYPYLSLYHLLHQRRSRASFLRDSTHKLEPFLPSVDSLILLCHDKQCRDPRDRVFALRGFFSREALAASPYPVDYNVALADLFRQTVAFFALDRLELDTRQVGGPPRTSIATYLASALECEELLPEDQLDVFRFIQDTKPRRVCGTGSREY
ncbi:heterokaryon incompatibility protein-domain-containing protein [Pestalotiopsis sp. NC0098]|nr:heterokaryon incompatibility protein-domain-containing protein [Pestalotiopsis sp. NC0098]